MKADTRAWSSEYVAAPALGVTAVGLLLWAAGGWSMRSATEDFYPWQLKVALLCGALAIQVVARRAPGVAFGLLLALLAWDAAFGPSVVLWIALSDVIYLAVATGSERLREIVLWTVLALTLAVTVAAALVGGVKVAIYAVLIAVAVLWTPIGYGRAVLAYRQVAELERDEGEARRASALAEERRRLARELHDTVAGHLSAVAILADAAQRTGDRAALQSIRSGSLAALEEMRATINLLTSPDDAAVRTTLASLEPLIATAGAAGVDVTMDLPDGPLPTAVEAVLTRILGEVITNATKHAPGAPLTVTVDAGPEEFALTATNPRPSGPAPRGSGDGLRNIAFRAESVGGGAAAGPVGDAWVVRATVPVVAR